MNLTDAAIKVDSNVTIKIIDENGRVIRNSKIHNKATMHMVTGLLEFLSGSFTPVSTNKNVEYTTPDEISSYIPVKLHLGTVGVKMSGRESSRPKLTGINSSEFKIPTFDDYRLQNDITPYYTKITGLDINFDTINITSFDDPNNSMGLLLQVKLPAGRLTGRGVDEEREYFVDSLIGPGLGWVYYNTHKNVYESIFTELGLYSDTGALLARVLLDGETTVDSDGEVVFDQDGLDTNPITQSDKTSLVIEWRIGIISLGQNDYVISAAKTVPKIESISERNILKKYIEGNTVVVEVPDETTQIRNYAFKDMSSIISVILPKELGKGLGAGENAVGDYSFDGCSSLQYIKYKGSEEEWDTYVNEKIGTNNGLFTTLVTRNEVVDTYEEQVDRENFVLTEPLYEVKSVKVNRTTISSDKYTTRYDDSLKQYVVVVNEGVVPEGATVVITYLAKNQVQYDYAENQEE